MTNPTPVAGLATELAWVRTAEPVPVLLSSGDGARVWTGTGPPPLVVAGSSTGDLYLATDTGDLYRLSA